MEFHILVLGKESLVVIAIVACEYALQWNPALSFFTHKISSLIRTLAFYPTPGPRLREGLVRNDCGVEVKTDLIGHGQSTESPSQQPLTVRNFCVVRRV